MERNNNNNNLAVVDGKEDQEAASRLIQKMIEENQGAEGIHPETGKAKFNPYKIPPDMEIVNEYQVG